MTITSNLGLYLHIPFCVRKCDYCDFLSFNCSSEKLLSEYAVALREEIKVQGEKWPYREVDSIFIGGGTPSLLSGSDIKMLMNTIYEYFNVAKDTEITIESNPNSLTYDKLREYKDAGINRLSIGIQSFDNSVLGFLGRLHNKNEALNAYQNAKRAGFTNINLDLMFGIPGQSMKKWTDTVRQAIFLQPQHISLYSLSIEEGTLLHTRLENNEFVQMPAITDRNMYHEALDMLRKAGYFHYEISNVSLAGKQSHHNMKYWSYAEYLGMGLGASSFIGGRRYKNTDRMMQYIKCIKAHKAPIDSESIEDYSLRDEMGIFMFTGLRKVQGISLAEFKQRFGMDVFDVYSNSIVLRNKGLLVLDGDRLYITERGMDVSNKIMAEFV